ncbi:hypothetical protein [Spirillospora sp. CA-294931]|uniref:hypothetical protein n=1 Tax=Spirillospora sp. CA-294931 TaxID=3240042 RepID=UPI003D8DC8C3
MRDAWSSHEVWVYECLNCFATWQEEFDARHVADGHGGEAVVYEHDGHRCITPWCDHLCNVCGGQNVKVFSAPKAKRAVPPQAKRPDDLELVFKLRRLNAW